MGNGDSEELKRVKNKAPNSNSFSYYLRELVGKRL